MMVAPGALVLFTPFFTGLFFSKDALSGLIAGIIVSGIQIAFSASNTGGAWDNCKKYVEAGHLQRMPDQIARGMNEYVKKGDDEHKAAVVGDTVGDPLKDTSGPAINILIKLMAITSLVFGGAFTKYGGIFANTFAK